MSVYYKKCELGNDLEFSDELINNMLLILVQEASDDFWKILKYGKSDALSNPNYTISEQDKYDMIRQNHIVDGKELTRIRVLKFNNNIATEAHSEIRIFDGSWNVATQNNYSVAIGIEIISHNDIIVLDNVGKRTINVLRHEIYKIFNNAHVDKSIGKMSNVGIRGAVALFNDDYQGYQFALIANSA